MTANDVIRLYTELENLGIKIWLDGGWGVDALLGEQTRPHEDVDIVIQKQDVANMREMLEAQSYRDIPRDDTCPWNFVLGDDLGHLVDVHVIVFDEVGNGIYGPVENGDIYPADALIEGGVIAGHPVRCLSAECLVEFHTGYPLRVCDFQDVPALCKKFGIVLPEAYARALEGKTNLQA